MATVPNETADSPADVHLPWFWTLWRRNATWRDNLAKRAAHKALDIPEDDVNINVQKSGMGWKELAAIGALAGAGVGGGYMLGDRDEAPPAAVAPATPQAGSPVKGKIRFWVGDDSKTQLGEQEVKPN